MHYDNNKPKYIRRVIYALCIVAFVTLQNSKFSLPQIFGARALIILPVCVSIAMHEREVSAAVFGAFAGVLVDLSTAGDGFNSVVLMLICAVCSLLISHFMRNNLVTALVLNAGSLAVYQIFYIVFNLVVGGRINPVRQIFTFYLPSFIYTIVFVPVFYELTKIIYKNFKTTDE